MPYFVIHNIKDFKEHLSNFGATRSIKFSHTCYVKFLVPAEDNVLHFSRLRTTYALVGTIDNMWHHGKWCCGNSKVASPPPFSFCTFSRLLGIFSQQAWWYWYCGKYSTNSRKFVFLFSVPLMMWRRKKSDLNDQLYMYVAFMWSHSRHSPSPAIPPEYLSRCSCPAAQGLSECSPVAGHNENHSVWCFAVTIRQTPCTKPVRQLSRYIYTQHLKCYNNDLYWLSMRRDATADADMLPTIIFADTQLTSFSLQTMWPKYKRKPSVPWVHSIYV